MIRLLSDLPDNVVGIEAVDRVEANDYRDVLDPAVEAALQRHDRLRLLYVLGEKFEGYSATAAWEDTKLGIRHWDSWEKLAIVTDREWIADGVKALGWMIPADVRVFGSDRRAEAVAWVSE